MPELLATVAELRIFLDDPTLDEDRAELFLRIASGEVRGYTGQLFDLVENDEVILNGRGTRILLLPELPVLAVTEVLEAYATTDEATIAGPLDASPIYEWDEDGVLERIDGGVFRRRRRWYQITYDHGYATVPDEVKSVVLRAAGRAFENPEGIRQETLGRYSYTLAGEQAGIGLYAPDRRDLEPYRHETRGRAGTAAGVGS
jgi:hypothetical protein